MMPPSKGKSGCGIKIDAIKENFRDTHKNARSHSLLSEEVMYATE